MNRRDFLKRLAVIPSLAFLKPEASRDVVSREKELVTDDIIYVGGPFISDKILNKITVKDANS